MSTLLRRIRNELVPALVPARAPSRLLWYGAVLMMASTVLHSVVFLISDTTWSGAVSWRKPITFGFSFSLLFWSFGWVLDRLPDRRRLAWGLAGTFSITSFVEVGIITFQQWRGRPSHFNTFTSENALLFGLMGVMVIFISLALVGLFVWTLVERPTNRIERLAAIGGLALVLSGLGVGQQIINLGTAYADEFNRVPETVVSGDEGVAKFPHAIAFHGLQVFMIAAVLLGKSAVDRITAQRMMRTVIAAYIGVMVFSVTQTFGGRAPLDLGSISGILLGLSTMVLIGTLTVIVRSWLSSPPADPGQVDGGTGVTADEHRPVLAGRTKFGS